MPFFPTVVILDLYNLFVQYSIILIGKDFSTMSLSLNNTLLIPLVLSLIINVYGYFEAWYFCIERLAINTQKLPENVRRVRVVQISDLHLGVIVGEKKLNKVLELVEKEKPDIIVSTGDLVDGSTKHIGHLAEKLTNLKAGSGKFAVMGNHEIYGGAKQTAKFIKDSGFTLLRGKGVTVKNAINITGMDFMGGEAGKPAKNLLRKEEWEILSELPEGLFGILLKHRSDVEDRSLGLFDIQLSGHTHKGQIFPMNLATVFIFQHHSGFIKLPKGSSIHVSRGAGTAGPPVRFLSRPEITVIDILSD